MSTLENLAARSGAHEPGVCHTAREIVQQPDLWLRVLDMVEGRAPEIRAFLKASGAFGDINASLLLAGAGSSDFVGKAVASSLRSRLCREVAAVPTTHLVTHPSAPFSHGRPAVVIHFARSGDSPESLAALRLVRRVRPDARHIVITCNESGALRREAEGDADALVLTLPPEANDKSLAMTSSFTSMALCAISLGWMDDLPRLRGGVALASAAARGIIASEADSIASFAGRGFDRACYLGSDSLAGAMREAALKMLELTAGHVAALSDSFLGIRHGPQVFINGSCAVVACLSSEPGVRRYEMDLLRELRRKGQGQAVLAISARGDEELASLADLSLVLGRGPETLPDALRVMTDLVVCQILAFSRSRLLGLDPDNPSPAGLINRVVQGIRIYDSPG